MTLYHEKLRPFLLMINYFPFKEKTINMQNKSVQKLIVYTINLDIKNILKVK